MGCYAAGARGSEKEAPLNASGCIIVDVRCRKCSPLTQASEWLLQMPQLSSSSSHVSVIASPRPVRPLSFSIFLRAPANCCWQKRTCSTALAYSASEDSNPNEFASSFRTICSNCVMADSKVCFSSVSLDLMRAMVQLLRLQSDRIPKTVKVGGLSPAILCK